MSALTWNFATAALSLATLLLAATLLAGLDRVLARAAAGGGWAVAELAELPRSALRLLLKEFRSTDRPDRRLWLSGPVLLLALAMAAAALLPGMPGSVDPPAGLVCLGALLLLPAVAVFVTAWGPNSKFPLLAGYRYLGLVVAVTLPLALVLLAAALPAGALRLGALAAHQQALGWNLLLQPVGFLVYLIAALALAFQGPFRLLDGPDLGGGIELELGGAALLLWRLGCHALLLVLAWTGAALFLGAGAALPAKALLLAAGMLALSHWLPPLPLERFMTVAWTVLLPAALLNLLWVAWRSSGGLP